MHRIKITVLAAIVAAMLLHLYFIGNKSIAKPIGYSGSVKMIERNYPVQNLSGMKFPSDEEKKYIYVFVIDGDKLNYRRYDIKKDKTININVPKNKDFIICTESNYSSENNWSWHSDFIDLEAKGKVAKFVDNRGFSGYSSVLEELKGERYHNACFQFFGESIGTEKISLVYGNGTKDYFKIPININVQQ